MELVRHKFPLDEMWDWAEGNITKTERIQAIKLALEIWDDANAEGVTAKSEGGEPGKPQANREPIPDGTAVF
jgi:hypothetical protein